MAPVHGISWDDRKRRVVSAMAAATAVVLSAGALATTAHASDAHLVSVIVRAQPGEIGAAGQDVTALGGHVDQQIGLINALVADVPANAVAELAATPVVAQVTPNGSMQLLGSSYSGTGSSYDPATDVDSMYNIEEMDGAHAYWDAGYTGQGVGVALINSGVDPVNGLQTPGKVVNGPDYSSDIRVSVAPEPRRRSVTARTWPGSSPASTTASPASARATASDFMGMAPNAQIVNVKVADATGQTTVAQVLIAISWVVQHQNSNGMNIGVLNLSYGTDTNNSYELDPLAYAAEQAWLHGIVVVVAAGNEGNYSDGLEDPAIDPYVIAVGASDTENTTNVANDSPPASPAKVTARATPTSQRRAPTSCRCATRDPSSTTPSALSRQLTVASSSGAERRRQQQSCRAQRRCS